MIDVEVRGSVARLSRREIAHFVRLVLLTLEKRKDVREPISSASIAFVSDDEMKVLNKRFRGRATTTDVLTFPGDAADADPDEGGRPLGDIVICLDQARRQAAEEKHSLPTEVRYLLLHGILHALGFDHETDNGQMNALELELRREVGLES